MRTKLLGLFLAALLVLGFAGQSMAMPWKFGILSDTQWVTGDDGKNPYSTAIDIINQANQAFIANNVKFVIAVGDLVDSGTVTTAITNSSWYPSLNASSVQANCAASALCTGTFTATGAGTVAAGTFASGATYNGNWTWSVGAAGQAARAVFAQSLYNAGIGFFPHRGNHDDSQGAAGWVQYLYPQTQNGNMNATPSDAFGLINSAAYPDTLDQPAPPIANPGVTFNNGWTVLGSPSANLTGLSYGFTYAPPGGGAPATFVLIDQFTPLDGVGGSSGVTANPGGGAEIDSGADNQLAWINTTLASNPNGKNGGQAFVFSHKGLITEDHTDVLFGSDPSKDPSGTNTFIESLYANGVEYYINGHDHMHVHELVIASDANETPVHELVCASNSNKFYTPNSGTSENDLYDVHAFGYSRQTLLSEELYYIPYYIVTVDGPKVTFDYYGVNSNGNGSNIATTPTLTGNWLHRETFGYSLNGHEFLVAQGASYTTVTDSIATGTDAYGSTFYGTSAAILAGTNGSKGEETQTSRAWTKSVNTGWAPQITGEGATNTISDIFTLWGMADVSQVIANQYDAYAVRVSYNPTTVTTAAVNAGHPAYLATSLKDGNGNITGWAKAAQGRFILGPWNAKYPAGYYGLDMSTNTAWANVSAINGSVDFAVIQP